MDNTSALIAMGGNQGDVPAAFRTAVEKLSALPGIQLQEKSSLYRTTPVGNSAGATYTNAAIAIECRLPPVELLDELQQIENELGRHRSIHWGPRPLDLDIIGLGQEVVHTERLTIPHTACAYRRFVVDPLFEIAPEWQHPRLRQSVTEIRNELLQRPLPIQLDEQVPATIAELFEEASQRYPIILKKKVAPLLIITTHAATHPRELLVPKTKSLSEIATTFVEPLMTALFDEPVRGTDAW